MRIKISLTDRTNPFEEVLKQIRAKKFTNVSVTFGGIVELRYDVEADIDDNTAIQMLDLKTVSTLI